MRPPPTRLVVLGLLAVAGLLAGCSSGPSATGSLPAMGSPDAPGLPSAVSSAVPSAVPSASAAALPASVVGTWVGTEHDFDSGANWETSYRIAPCIPHTEVWKKPTDDQRCGEWTARATIEGLPAECMATLTWVDVDGGTFVFLASGPEGSKYETYPHPYVKVGDRWYCWDSFRLRLTPGSADTLAVETLGGGEPATEGSATRAGS